MKKKILQRGFVGFLGGVTLGQVIVIILSLIWGQGHFWPCVPDFISMVGNEIGAVALQTVLCGLLGTGFAAASVIWELEHWSLVKQTGIYFFVVSLVMLPIAYVTYWMEHSILGFFSYFGIFFAIFVVVWLVQYFIGRQNIRRMNAELDRLNRKK